MGGGGHGEEEDTAEHMRVPLPAEQL